MTERIGQARKVVLDTSVFTNPDIRQSLGATPTDAFLAFLALARRVDTLAFFMPPSIWSELGTFLDTARVPPDAELIVQRKAPATFEMTVPAFLLYELIEDVRRRVDKGLRVVEEAARSVVSTTDEQEVISTLRRKYREALREGIIDSTEDVELVLLAKELDALVVSADRGVVTWAEKLGLRWLDPRQLAPMVRSLAEGSADAGQSTTSPPLSRDRK